jgi:hypothetical protein
MSGRIINIRYICDGLNFDAAVDCNWNLHPYYGISKDERNETVPVELYCLDKPEWDIRMVIQNGTNEQERPEGCFTRTVFDWEVIMKETREWIEYMKSMEDKE